MVEKESEDVCEGERERMSDRENNCRRKCLNRGVVMGFSVLGAGLALERNKTVHSLFKEDRQSMRAPAAGAYVENVEVFF